MLLLLSIRPLLAIFTFWWPLMLSVKALKAPGQNVQFLLTYWLLYTCILHIQGFLSQLSVPLLSIILLIGDLAQLWMFYSHGCLLILYYYIPDLFGGNTISGLVEVLDREILNPLVRVFWVNNILVQNVLNLKSSGFPPLDDFLVFNRTLCESQASKKTRVSFLQYSLEYFCYIDSDRELNSRYAKYKGFLENSISFFVNSRRFNSKYPGSSKIRSFSDSVNSQMSPSKETFRSDPSWYSTPHSRKSSASSSRNPSPKELRSEIPESTRFFDTRKHSSFDALPRRFFSDHHDDSPHSSPTRRWISSNKVINVKKRTRSHVGTGDYIDPPYPVRTSERFKG